MSARGKQEVIALYRKRAKRYNFTANLYYLIGFREWAYRRMAVKALHLRKGDTVVEIGCGTGLNFSLLQEEIGPEGKIIGVDMSDDMLIQARNRAGERGWNNVELIQSDAAEFKFPGDVDGIISTLALSLVPEFDEVIQNGAKALSPGRRWVILDLKIPSNWISRFAPLFVFLARPFGVTMEAANRQPWESMKKHLKNVSVTELYMGMAYLAVGEA